ncbi:MAG: hypothetical protein K9H48_15720 [Melioribacteraceae bacterium]|nr:hypothetical protein [Melioribacteraceae bacterium]MCF8395441.1 hypothetical protein [Melioribacteraceae bacterium]
MKQILSVTILLFLVSCGISSRLYKPQKIKVDGDYIHYQTKITFPVKINNFIRKEITSFDVNAENVGVTYDLDDKNTFSEFTIYIYPAGAATESRITQQYFTSLQSIANVANKEIDATQEILPYQKDNYKVNGLFAKINDEKIKTSLTLFECGKWFLKYRITTNSSDENYLDSLRNRLLVSYCPIDIVKKFPVNTGTNIYLAPAAKQDTLFLACIIGNALGRNKWIYENVDSLERCSGFPNFYLESHSLPMKEMIDWYEENKIKYPKELWNHKYILSIKKIIENNFLNEFLMDEYSMLLIAPDNIEFRFEEYYKWKKKNLPDFNLKAKYFVLEQTET